MLYRRERSENRQAFVTLFLFALLILFRVQRTFFYSKSTFNPKDPCTLPIYDGPSVRVLMDPLLENERNPTIRHDLITKKDIFFSDSLYRSEAREKFIQEKQDYASPTHHTLYNQPLYGFSGCRNLLDAYRYGDQYKKRPGQLLFYTGIRPVPVEDTSRYKVIANDYIGMDRDSDDWGSTYLRFFGLHPNIKFYRENEIYHLYAQDGVILEKPLNGSLMNYSDLVDWAIDSLEVEKALRGELVRNYFDNQLINVTLWQETHNKKSHTDEYKKEYKKFSIFANSIESKKSAQIITERSVVQKNDINQTSTSANSGFTF